MILKGIVDEDFINYKLPSMYIATATCLFKCDKEYGTKICQNSVLAQQPSHIIDNQLIVDRYLKNDITKAIVFGGLEPFDLCWDLVVLIGLFRSKTKDDIVIYTGYTKEEASHIIVPFSDKYHEDPNAVDMDVISVLEPFRNIVIKFGRYIPNQQPHYDPVLGVYLASDNQYAERIS